MNAFKKALTTLQLVARGDWSLVRRQVKINIGQARLRSHGGKIFSYEALGFPAVCHPDWPDSADQFVNLSGDCWEMALLKRWIRPNDLVVDAGTSLGLYTFAALQVIKQGTGRILAVDADAYAIEKLAAAAVLLGAAAVVPIHSAIADHDGEATFYVRRDHSVTSEQSLQPSSSQRASPSVAAVTVPLCTLPSLCARHANGRQPQFVKIDIEGAEAAALQAVPESWFAPDGPGWLLEIHPEALRRFGTEPWEVVRRFNSSAYEKWLLPKHALRPGASMALRRLEASERFEDNLYYNFIALPRGARWQERRQALRDLLPFQ
jgi:FkbM family methyltransferase